MLGWVVMALLSGEVCEIGRLSRGRSLKAVRVQGTGGVEVSRRANIKAMICPEEASDHILHSRVGTKRGNGRRRQE